MSDQHHGGGGPELSVVRHAFPVRGASAGMSRPPWARQTASGVQPVYFGAPPKTEPEAPLQAAMSNDEPPSSSPYDAIMQEIEAEEFQEREEEARLSLPVSPPPSSIRPSVRPSIRSSNQPVSPRPESKAPESDASMRALREAADALVRARTQVLAEVESELLELAVDIATVLVEDELASRPELHRALVRAAIGTIEPGSEVRVRAPRATYEGLLEAFDSPVVESGRGRVQVELDDTLDGLGAVVQAGGATVDGRVHRRLDTLRRALIDARSSRDAA